jgi:hypothetical protein
MQFRSYNDDERISIRDIKSEIKEIKQGNKDLRFCIIILICLVAFYLYTDNQIRIMLARTTGSLAKELMCIKNQTEVIRDYSESS